jgi:hypothetical protein
MKKFLSFTSDEYDSAVGESTMSNLNYIKRKKEFVENDQDIYIDEEDMKKQIETAPWRAALIASFAYSASQLNKEKGATCVGCSTIFLIVFMASFICVF